MLSVPAVGGEADLLLGQAVGDGDERVALLVDVGDEALALVGDGWDVGCHGWCLPLSRCGGRRGHGAGRSRPRGG